MLIVSEHDPTDIGTLSPAEVTFFRHSGYLRLPDPIEPAELEQLRTEAERLFREAPADGCRHADDGSVYRISAVVGQSAAVDRAATSPQLLPALASLLGPNIELLLNRHNHLTRNRPGNPSRRFHRDILQWSRSIITAVIYLDDAPAGGGCTYVIPGTHLLPCAGKPNNGGTWLDDEHRYADLLRQAVPVPMERGGMLLFDSLLYHAAEDGGGGSDRRILTFAYHSVDELSEGKSDNNRMLVAGEPIYRGTLVDGRLEPAEAGGGYEARAR